MKRLGILAIISVMAFSCVMNKKVVYLQDDDYYGKDLPYNQWVNEYEVKYEKFTLKPGDVISIRIGSLTPSEFNFIKEYEQQLGQFRKLNQYHQNNLSKEGSGNANPGQMLNSTNPLNTGIVQYFSDNYLSGFEIDPDGFLTLPKIGTISVEDKTINEVEIMIKDSLKGYFEEPVVKVEFMSFQFSIFGEVTKEGRYTSYEKRTSIFDAIALADNLTNYADRSRIKLIRKEGESVKTAYINLLDENILNSEFYYLRPGDKIVVPPLKVRVFKNVETRDLTPVISLLASVTTLLILISR